MSTDPIAILERAEFHLRGARRAALDASDATAFRAADAALDTVRELIRGMKEQRDLTQQTLAELLRMRTPPKLRRGRRYRQVALNELGENWRDDVATWQKAA